MPTQFDKLIPLLSHANAEFIIVGGVAARAHGSARLTDDLDIAYRRSNQNISRIVAVLAPYDPYLRGAPRGLPFRWDAATIQSGLNFTLFTTLGAIDLLGEVTGGGRYEDMLSHSITQEFYGYDCLCLDLPTLIKVKRAAGRPKDLEAIAELEAIVEERKHTDPDT
jgi:hypothetical protein